MHSKDQDQDNVNKINEKNIVVIFSLRCANLRTMDSTRCIILKLRICLNRIMILATISRKLIVKKGYK